MKLLEKIADLFAKYMAIIVLVVAGFSLFIPKTGLWVKTDWINYLLMIIMFGMGLTLKPKDFANVFKRPKEVIIGCLAQFIVMPALAFLLCHCFHLNPALTAGVILVGTCPGGTASNVITYFAGGDVALSIGMTSVNTLLAPIVTPAITYLLLNQTVKVDVVGMFVSIVQVILIPIILGFIVNKFLGFITERIVKILPMISTIAICLIVAAVVSNNSEKILTTGHIILIVVVLHNMLGYLCGFGLGKALKLNPEKTKALSIEIGMQNSGLATSLATTAFPNLAMATVPGAIFSVWHNISGAVLAGIYRKWKNSSQVDGEK